MSRLIVFIIHCRCSHHSVHNTTPQVPWSPHRMIELATNLRKVFTIKEKSSTRAFSWLKELSHLRHYSDTMLNWRQSKVSRHGDADTKVISKGQA